MRWRWMHWWYRRAYECPWCGWQGMCEPAAPLVDAECPECGEMMPPRSWMDTWGRTLIILGVVAVVVLFVGYFGRRD